MDFIICGRDYFGVPFPLVLGDRFFHVYRNGNGFELDVFRWDEAARKAVYEVRSSKPVEDDASASATGVATFHKEGETRFLYKFRPRASVPRILGKVPAGSEFEADISDRRVVVRAATSNGRRRTKWQDLCVLERNQLHGPAIGVQVGVDNSVGIGVTSLPEGLVFAGGRWS